MDNPRKMFNASKVTVQLMLLSPVFMVPTLNLVIIIHLLYVFQMRKASSVQIYTTMDNGTCNGDAYISQQVQNPVNYIMVGEDTLQNINSNYANFNDHCAGVYTLNTQNPITGTTINTTPFVIPNSQNFYGAQVPTSAITIVDTLTLCIQNCLI